MFRVLQLTDLHLLGDPDEAHYDWNTQQSFDQVFAAALAEHQPDALLLTGDITNDAEPAAYERLASQIAKTGLKCWTLPGNHDDPGLLTEAFETQKLGHDKIIDMAGWRIVLLDSTVPGEVTGTLSSAELTGLQLALESAADKPTMICLHHPPVSMLSPWMDSIALTNGDQLVEIVDNHDQVRAVVWGHAHQAFDETRLGVRYLCAPSTGRQFMPGAESFALDEQATPGWRWLELYADSNIGSSIGRLPSL